MHTSPATAPATEAGISSLAAAIVAHTAADGTKDMIALAESCTGGMVAAAITDIAGSSAALDRGFVTYSNAAKMDMLGVSAAVLERHGAVSAETAAQMVMGVLSNAPDAKIAVAVTGIAGPGGGSDDKPVGLVHFASQRRGEAVVTAHHIFTGDRKHIRLQATHKALMMIHNHL